MHARVRISSVILLCVALNAMLLAPALHQLEHLRAYEEAHAERPDQADALRAGLDAFSSAAAHPAFDLSGCVVCGTTLQTILSARTQIPVVQAIRFVHPEIVTYSVRSVSVPISARAPPAA